MRASAAWVGTDRLVFCVPADWKRAEAAKARGESDDLNDGRPKKKMGVLLQMAPRARRTGSAERCVALSVLVWHYIGYISFRFRSVIIFQIGGPQSGASTIENVDTNEN